MVDHDREEDPLVKLKFRIGEVFPASDPVARYVTGVAMIANDWGRLFRLMEAIDEAEAGTRLLLYRLMLSFHVEAVMFLRRTERQFPIEVRRFLDILPAEGLDLHRDLVAAQSVAALRAESVRNQSFHYPRVLRARFDRGTEEMARLLEAASDLEGHVEASPEQPDFLEYGFADEVIVQMLPADADNETDRDAVALFRDRALSFRRFAELVVSGFVDGQPNDDLDLVDTPGV